jgi:uncharacterized protein (DUF58 family)
VEPVFSAEPPRSSFMSGGLVFFVVLDVAAAIVLAFFSLVAAVSLLVAGLFTAAVLWLVLPRRFEVTPEEIRIVLGARARHRIGLGTVAEVRPGKWHQALAYAGIRYAIPSSEIVEIKRSSGMNVVISPKDADEFIRQANLALDRFRRRGSTEGEV